MLIGIRRFFMAGISTIKKTLVGDLNWDDLSDLANFRAPESLSGIIIGDTTENDPEVIVKQFGLVGRLFGINFASIQPKKDSSQLIKDFLKKVDHLPKSRSTYERFDEMTGYPNLIATSGEKGIDMRKTFHAILPSPLYVLERTIKLSRDSISRVKSVNKLEYLKIEPERTEKIVEAILVDVFLGCEFTLEIQRLISHMSMVLLSNPYSPPPGYSSLIKKVKQEYNQFVTQLIKHAVHHQQKANSSALSKLIHKHQSNTESLINDPALHALMTALITASNVSDIINRVWSVSDLMSSDAMKNLLLEIKATELFTPEENIHDFNMKLQKVTTLDAVFKECLFQHSFAPSRLPRYISQDIYFNGTRIPAGTTLFFNHRSLEKPGEFNPGRFQSAAATQLNTPDLAPFGLGQRKCPGDRITENIFKGVVAVIATQLESTLTDELNQTFQNPGYRH